MGIDSNALGSGWRASAASAAKKITITLEPDGMFQIVHRMGAGGNVEFHIPHIDGKWLTMGCTTISREALVALLDEFEKKEAK